MKFRWFLLKPASGPLRPFSGAAGHLFNVCIQKLLRLRVGAGSFCARACVCTFVCLCGCEYVYMHVCMYNACAHTCRCGTNPAAWGAVGAAPELKPPSGRPVARSRSPWLALRRASFKVGLGWQVGPSPSSFVPGPWLVAARLPQPLAPVVSRSGFGRSRPGAPIQVLRPDRRPARRHLRPPGVRLLLLLRDLRSGRRRSRPGQFPWASRLELASGAAPRAGSSASWSRSEAGASYRAASAAWDSSFA